VHPHPENNDDCGLPQFACFEDLRARGIVKSRQGLRNLQITQGFPIGRLLGPATRVWTVAEVNEWLASRPVEPSQQSKIRVEKSIAARKERAA
jgi:hypothetical protein